MEVRASPSTNAPSNWKAGVLSEFWAVTDCKHVTAKFVGEGYPLASIREVQHRFVDLKHANQTTERYFNELIEGGRRPRAGDLILSRNATVGEVALVADWHPPFAMGQDVCLLRKRREELSSEFLYALFESIVVRQQFADFMVGSTFKRANVQQIRGLKICMPPIDEQNRIASSLTDTDALIDSLEQLLTKKRQIKQGAMQELLTGKRRLPGFCQPWSEVRLGEVGRTYGGLTGKGKADFGHGAAKYITFMNVMISVRTSAEMVERVQVGPTEAQNMVQPGDLLFNGSSETPEEVALCSWVESCAEGIFLNSFCFGFRPFVADRISGLFMAYYFRGRPGRTAVCSLAQGATRYNIAKTALLQAPLTLPSLDEQQAIAEVLSSMDEEITALQYRLTKARDLKQAMAQALLTGRIRLVESAA